MEAKIVRVKRIEKREGKSRKKGNEIIGQILDEVKINWN